MHFGYQAVYDFDFFDAIDYAAENGFAYVCFDLNVPCFYIDSLTKSQISRIEQYAAKKAVSLSFHAPGDNVSLYCDYPGIRDGILSHFKNIIRAAEQLRAKRVTVHPGLHPSLRQTGCRSDDFIGEYATYFGNVLYENFARLAEEVKTVELCIENCAFTELTMKTVDRALDSLQIYLTWDIAKTFDPQLRLLPGVEEFMRSRLDKVREVHIHDASRNFRTHQTVGTGDLDFSVYAELIAVEDKAVTIEVRPREQAAVSKEALLRQLRLPLVSARSAKG